jgi:hypothetical protein
MGTTKTRKQKLSDWVIAIPSYKRAETLRDKTLAVLTEYSIPAQRIHVFVANKEEYEIYKNTLHKNSYGFLHIAKPGMAAVRNFITQFFPVGKPIFNMDDDIRGFIEWSPTARRNEQPLKDLRSAITHGFQEARRTGFRLFGFYPVANGFFMKEEHSEDIRYIIGSVWGIINPGKILTVSIDDKEDYLRSVIMYILDGGVIRFNNISPQSAYYKESGGMQETRTFTRIEKSAKAMVKSFPDFVSLNMSKRSGIPEVRLRDSRPPEERTFGEAILKKHIMPTI